MFHKTLNTSDDPFTMIQIRPFIMIHYQVPLPWYRSDLSLWYTIRSLYCDTDQTSHYDTQSGPFTMIQIRPLIMIHNQVPLPWYRSDISLWYTIRSLYCDTDQTSHYDTQSGPFTMIQIESWPFHHETKQASLLWYKSDHLTWYKSSLFIMKQVRPYY